MFTAANKFIGVSRNTTPPIDLGDPYWDQTSVLMHMDSGAFPDVKNHTTSIVGTITLDTTIKKFGTGSARHPGGTGNALEIQNNQGFNFGSDDFTIEAQLYVEALGTNGAIILGAWDTNSDWMFYINPSRQIGIQINGGAFSVASSITVPLTTWTHVCVIRDGGTFTLYVNGAFAGALNTTLAINYNAGNKVRTSMSSDTLMHLQGNIDELRVTKGVARQLLPFTAPTAPYTEYLTQYDAFYPYTTMLTPFDGSIADKRLHPNALIGSATLTTGAKKFGTGSLQTTGGYLFTDPSSDFTLSGDFTVECWVRQTVDVQPNAIISVGAYTNGILIRNQQNGADCVYVNGLQVAQPVGGLFPIDGLWHHLAVVRYGTVVITYVDGLPVNTITGVTGVVNSTGSAVYLGTSAHALAEGMTGNIDDFRVTNGIARYTQPFIPPVSAFSFTDAPDPYYANVSLLMHMDSATYIDEKGHTITAMGSVSTTTAQARFGARSSLSSNGTSYVDVAANTAFEYQGDVTIEWWQYFTSLPSNFCPMIGNYVLPDNIQNWVAECSNVGHFSVYVAGNSNLIASAPGTIAINKWNHLAIVRRNGVYATYCNGVQIGTRAVGFTTGSPSVPIYIGGRDAANNPGSYTNAYADEVRITKGVGRYNRNFVPQFYPFANN